jgi:aspartyl/glutamyl-tRNA(Asn/Gln) amidotransferase C subunit
MLTKGDVEGLLALARMELEEGEKEDLRRDLAAIISYVEQVKSVTVGSGSAADSLPVNVMRPDDIQNEPGSYSEALVAAAPERQDGFIKVKKIL